MKTTGQKIKEARLAANMTQAELAEAIGKSQETVHYYEINRHAPRLEPLRRIAQVLGLDPGQLI